MERSPKDVQSFAVLYVAVLVAAVAIALAFAAQPAWADDSRELKDIYSGTEKVLLYKDTMENEYIYSNYSDESKYKVAGVSVSNKKVLKAEGDSYGNLFVTVKKVGTSKVSYRYKGKKHTVTFKVFKYQNPVKSLKIGSKQYASKVKSTDRFSMKRKLTGKINVKAASGWKLTKIVLWGEFGASGKKVAKNGYKVTAANELDRVEIYLKNKKTGVVEELRSY